MYGLFGDLRAIPGQRDALVAILLENTTEMPDCNSDIVAQDPADDVAVWVSELWTRQQAHQDSLKLPGVISAISKARQSLRVWASVLKPGRSVGLA
jgi:quinol monooxygenase YgiN